jgi:hypothetical protein
MNDPKKLGLINALMANRADTRPRLRGALEQLLAKSEHDRLVEKLRVRLVSNFFSDIKVDLQGYAKPDRIVWADTRRGHEPDARAYYMLKQHIFEVETADSIGDDHTYEQCRLFAAYVRNRFAEFALIVPIGSALAAWSQLSRWGLIAIVQEI